MNSIHTTAELRAHLARLRADVPIAFVPTMGALHAGHLSLVQMAAQRAAHVVVSIFVNPAQFAPHEDFESYPRTLAADVAALQSLNLQNLVIFAPSAADIYPPNAPAQTQITLGDIDTRWESEFRPHFFGGVALVVNKLFNIVQPDIAIFGEKDFQQLQVIRQMVQDLSMPIEVMGAPIMREETGLAMSSRNVYLDSHQRFVIAPTIYRTLSGAAEEIRGGEAVSSVLDKAKTQILSAGFDQVDYLAYVQNKDLSPLAHLVREPSRLLVAAWLGKTRLIDGVAVT